MNTKILNINFGKYSLTLTKRIGNHLKEQTDDLKILPRQEYDRFFENISQWFIEHNERDEKLQMLNFLLTIVKKDIQIDLLTEIYYKERKYITGSW